MRIGTATVAEPTSLLCLSCEPGSAETVLRRLLDPAIVRIVRADDSRSTQWLPAKAEFSVVVLELCSGGAGPLETLKPISERWPRAAVVVLDAAGCIDRAVEAMRLGAFDYIADPSRDLPRVVGAVRAALGRPSVGAQGAAESAGVEQLDGIPLSLDAYERRALERALEVSGGDTRRAARCLGIGRSTFYRKAARLGMASGLGVTKAPGRVWGAGPGVGRSPAIG
jgi:DNA-binding NtrC family response regulator